MSRPPSSRPPGLGTTVFLYTTGVFLVILAILLILQAFGILPALPNIVYIALVLLAIGSGLLYGIGNRA